MRLLIGCLLCAAASVPVNAGFVKKDLNVGGARVSYQVFVPENWSADRSWPVILFLHGAGERGSDGVHQTQVGLGPVIRLRQHDFPAVVVMPQCPRGRLWNDPAVESQVMAALEEAMSDYKGDPARVYLTGLSMGGYGVYYFASRYPDRFAALAPVCGGIVPPGRVARRSAAPVETDAAAVARRIGSTPIWIFHGQADMRVPVTESRRAVEALRPHNGDLRYTEYAGVGHNSWDRAYSEAGFFDWLFAQRRGP